MDGEQRKVRARGEQVLWDTMTLAGRSDASYSGETVGGRCRMRYVVGRTSSALQGPATSCDGL